MSIATRWELGLTVRFFCLLVLFWCFVMNADFLVCVCVCGGKLDIHHDPDGRRMRLKTDILVGYGLTFNILRYRVLAKTLWV